MSLRFDRESCARRRAAAQTAAAHLEPVAQERASAITSRAFVDISPPKSAKRRFIQQTHWRHPANEPLEQNLILSAARHSTTRFIRTQKEMMTKATQHGCKSLDMTHISKQSSIIIISRSTYRMIQLLLLRHPQCRAISSIWRVQPRQLCQ